MFEDADNFADIFRGGLPYYLLITLPILICFSSSPVTATEFSVQRMVQYDVHGVSYGCRASALNLEAKSIFSWSTSRHCVVARFQDLTIDQFREIRAKAGGLVILLPENLNELSLEDREQIYLLEQAMMVQEISIPVYFSKYNDEMDGIINDITHKLSADKAQKEQQNSALAEIFNSVSANGYQMVISGASNAVNKQSKIPIVQGELVPLKTKSDDSHAKLPLIIVTAQLNTLGLLSQEVKNLDVAALFTIADLFSKLHTSQTTAPKYRILFLVSESNSLLNFQGTKKWLDSNLDDNAYLQNAEFVVCLDSIGRHNLESDSLFMHVSKPPKEGTHINNFYKTLKNVARQQGNRTVEGVHKKINLADVLLAWEHERFSMKRLSAFTLSGLKSHKDPLRTSIFEESEEKTMEVLARNTKIIAEALANYMYNLNGEGELFTNSMNIITKESIKPWTKVRSSLQNNDLKGAFEKYLKNVKFSFDKPDARDPDFMLYDGLDAQLNVYNVKPAIFDLFLTLLIAMYLTTAYFSILYFPRFYSVICKLASINQPTTQLSRDKVKAN